MISPAPHFTFLFRRIIQHYLQHMAEGDTLGVDSLSTVRYNHTFWRNEILHRLEIAYVENAATYSTPGGVTGKSRFEHSLLLSDIFHQDLHGVAKVVSSNGANSFQSNVTCCMHDANIRCISVDGAERRHLRLGFGGIQSSAADCTVWRVHLHRV